MEANMISKFFELNNYSSSYKLKISQIKKLRKEADELDAKMVEMVKELKSNGINMEWNEELGFWAPVENA